MRRRSRAFAPILAGLALLATVVVAGGCEGIVGDTVPSFTCTASAGSCPQDQVCAPMLGVCIDKTKACAVTGCADGQTCNTGTQSCIASGGDDAGMMPDTSGGDDGPIMMMDAMMMQDTTPPPDSNMSCRGVGCPCAGPSACDSGICGDTLTLTVNITQAAGGSICTTPCCSSTDCPAGSVCFVAGNGGNYCVPPSVVGRMTPGTKQGGAACTTGTECRSGLCGSTNVCEDACCSANTASCTAGASCAFGKFFGATFDQHSGFRCATGGGSGGNESTCFRDTDCKSTLCANFGGGFNSTCHAPCRNTADCSNGDACVDFQTASMTDISVACVAPQGQANVGLGGQCGSNDSVCKSQQCDRATGKCSDVCFSDADCSSASGYKCRPTTITLMGGGMVTVLACVPG